MTRLWAEQTAALYRRTCKKTRKQTAPCGWYKMKLSRWSPFSCHAPRLIDSNDARDHTIQHMNTGWLAINASSLYSRHNNRVTGSCVCILEQRSSLFWDVARLYVELVTDVSGQHISQICALLGYYAASCGNCLPTFRDNVSVPSSRVKSPRRKESRQAVT
jgi:hypothetical protein